MIKSGRSGKSVVEELPFLLSDDSFTKVILIFGTLPMISRQILNLQKQRLMIEMRLSHSQDQEFYLRKDRGKLLFDRGLLKEMSFMVESNANNVVHVDDTLTK